MFNPSKYIKITILILIIFLATNIALPAIYSHQLVKTARAQIPPIIKPILDVLNKVKELAKKYPYMTVFLGLSATLFTVCGIAGLKVLGTGAEVTGVCNIAHKIIEWLEEHAKDYFNSFLKKKLLDYLTDSIVRWIQGEEGKPLFVTNWRQFLGKVINDSVGEYIQTTQAAFLCQPFKARVIFNLPMPGRPPLPTCTLNQIVENIEDFYDDFRNGGWIAYNEMLYPWNNPYGSYLMALDGEISEVAMTLAEKEKEAQQAQGGFLAIKRCKPGMEIIDPSTNEFVCIEYETVTPGNVVAEQVTGALGSSLNFIANSNDLTVYITAIADAAINRLIKETLSGGGLSTMSTSNAPEELGTAPSSGYFTSTYSCVSNVCQQAEGGEYEDVDACLAGCTASAEPSCDNCTGVYVRGRYSYPYNNNSNDTDCSGNVCGKCSSVSPGKGACGAFCQNIVGSELWPKQGVPETFGHDVLVQYEKLFDKFGYTIPSTCTCNSAILGNGHWASYGIAAGGGGCQGCVELPVAYACDSAGWCEENCSGE